MDRPALVRWWGRVVGAGRYLLVGPEPPDTPVKGVVALLSGRWRRLVSVTGALLLVLLGAADWAALDQMTAFYRLLPVGLAVVGHAVPVALAVYRPLLAWRISVLATVLTPAVTSMGASSELPWPPVVGVLHLLVLVQLAAAVPRPVAVLAAVIDGIAMAAIMARSTTFDVGLVQGALVLIALVTALGVSVGAWQATSGRLAEHRRRILHERDRRAVMEERNRIARELHDVVAHHLSLIAVRAETAAFRNPSLDGDGRAELASVATDARSALAEMRRLLGVLRSERDAPEHAPQPQLADLPDLVDTARRSGMPVQLRVYGQPGASSSNPAVGLVAYRVVQEALSNASRHAPGATVQVDVHHLTSAVRIRVENAPPKQPAERPPTDEFGRSGYGLTGMRERVRMLTGVLSAGPTPDGGFHVDVTLPRDPRSGDVEQGERGDKGRVLSDPAADR